MTRKASMISALSVLLMAKSAFAQSTPPTLVPRLPATHFEADQLPDPAAVLALLDHSAAMQIARLRARPVGLSPGAIEDPTVNWVSAAFYTGLTRLTRISDRSEGTRFLREVAEHYNFGLRGEASDHSRLDADNIAIGETYQELYARSGEPGMITPLRDRLDWTLRYLTVDPAPKRLTWWWCDALFMAPPVMARMTVLTSDPAYLNAMDTQWWRVHERLWSPESGLYFRDERFKAKRSQNGRPVFWARGNGWVIGGIARVLESVPADYPHRAKYLQTFSTMAASVVRLQGVDGLWTSSLLDPQDPAGPESTGSAFFVYALAWGINHGVLDRATYLPAALRGWAGLAAAVQPDGLLGYAQRAGDQPWPARSEDHALYGTGALLLAGLEMMRLGEPKTSLPIPEPTPPVRAIFREPDRRLVAPQAAAIDRAAYDRALAERRAVYDLAFEPARDLPGGATSAGTPPGIRRDGIVNPRMTLPLTPPVGDARKPRATVRFAPYRYDDILWENDRTAHRIYGPALEAAEPPSGSGIDAWGKIVPWPFMERQLATGKQHDFHGEGIDFYNVGGSRGAGGIGVWQDNKLWVSRNWAKYRILRDGPDVADFEVDYAPWPVGVGRSVRETRRFTLPLGTNFTRMVSTISSDTPRPLQVAIGIQKRATNPSATSTFTADRVHGRFSLWTATDPAKGTMGIAVMVDPAMIEDVKEDADNHLIVLRVTPGKPFVYYMGSTWSKSVDFHDRAAWDSYVTAQNPSFALPQ